MKRSVNKVICFLFVFFIAVGMISLLPQTAAAVTYGTTTTLAPGPHVLKYVFVRTGTAVYTIKKNNLEITIDDLTITNPWYATIHKNGKLTITEIVDQYRFVTRNYTLSGDCNAWSMTAVGLGQYVWAPIETRAKKATAPTLGGETIPYDGQDHSLFSTGAAHGTVYYRVKTDEAWGYWSTTVPSRKDLGITYVQAYTKADDNYLDSDVTEGSIEIVKGVNPLTFVPEQTVNSVFSTEFQAIVLKPATNGQGNVSYGIASQKDEAGQDVSLFDVWGENELIIENVPAGKYTVVITAYAPGNKNYDSGTKDCTVTVTITKADMKPSVSMDGWTYGDTPNEPSVSGNTGGGSVVYTYQVNKTGEWTSEKPAAAGTHAVKASIAESANYNAGEAVRDFTIAKRPVTVSGITADNKTYDGNPEATLHTENAVFDGLKSGDTLTVASAKGTFANKDAGTGKAVTISNLTISGESAGNYRFVATGSQTGTTADITPKTLTITADEKTKTYGDADPALTYEHDGLESGDSITGTLSRAEGENAGPYDITQGTLTAGGNYTIRYTGEKLTITRRAATVTAGSQAVVLGGSIDSAAEKASLSGALPGHVLSSVTLTGSSTENATTAGVITPSGAKILDEQGTDVTENYQITYAPGKLTVQGKVYFIKQNPDGTWPAGAEGADSEVRPGSGTTYAVSADAKYEHYTACAWSTEYKPTEDGRTATSPGSNIPVGEGVNALYLYYALDSFHLNFYEDQAGEKLWKSEKVYYGTSLSGYAPGVDNRGEWTGNWQLSDRNSELFTFGGWATVAGETVYSTNGTAPSANVFDFSNPMPDRDVNLYPIWVANYINVRLNLGAYDAVADGQEKWYDASQYDKNTPATMGSLNSGDVNYQARSFWKSTNITANTPATDKYLDMSIMNTATRAGYTLDGWYTSGGAKWAATNLFAREYGDKDSSGNLILTYDAPYRNYNYTLTLTAHWTPAEIDVIFDTGNGGSCAESSGKTALGRTLVLPEVNEHEDRIFTGWKIGSEDTLHTGGEHFVFSDWTLTANNTLTITAQYIDRPAYAITFDTDDGTAIEPITGYAEGQQIEGPANPTRNGYTFTGWINTADNGPFTFPFTPDNISTIINLKAGWTVNPYTLTFNSNGGTEIDSITQDYNTIVSVASPTRTGYTFNGWNPALPGKMPAENRTFNATWTINSHTVTFDTDGGSTIAPETRNYGEFVVEPAAPSREGYTFDGWVWAAGGSGNVSYPFTMGDSDVIIRAAWKMNQNAPAAPALAAASDSVTVTNAVNTQEYIILSEDKQLSEADWKNARTMTGAELQFTGLTPNTSYAVWTRLMGDEGRMPSEPAQANVTTLKGSQNPPAAPAVTATAMDTVTVDPATDGEEYVLVLKDAVPGENDWRQAAQPENGKVMFTGLNPNTAYDVYARMKETGSQLASGPSAPATVTTPGKADPIANAPTGLTAIHGQTLADVMLTNPEGNTEGTWDWVNDTASVGTAGIHTFKADFRPTDTANYNSKEDVDVTVTVVRADNPAVIAETAAITMGGHTFDLEDNVLLNGATGAVRYAISGEAHDCTLNGSVLTSGADTGTVTVNVTIEADENYSALAATPIAVTIIDKQMQTVSASDVNATYGDTGRKISASTDGDGALRFSVRSGNAVTVDAATGALTIIGAGKAVITVIAAETDTCAADTKNVSVTVGKAAATITADDKSKTYGEKDPELTATVSGAIGGEKLAYTLRRTEGENAGEYTITVNTDSNPNYDVTAVEGKLSITPKSIAGATVTLNRNQLVYTGAEQRVVLQKVTIGETVLDANDYTAEGLTGTAVGDYTVTVTGRGNYRDSATAGWTIDAAPEKKDEKEIFVDRCYRMLLGRKGDEEGLKAWVELLDSGKLGAAEVVYGLAVGEEFTGRKLDSEAVAEALYQAMLDRAPSAEEKTRCADALEKGTPISAVINSIARTEEFRKICKTMGVRPGKVRTGLLPGDVNADGTVDGRDAVQLMKYLAGEEDPETGEAYEIDQKASDLNGDGEVSELDLLRLMKMLAE